MKSKQSILISLLAVLSIVTAVIIGSRVAPPTTALAAVPVATPTVEAEVPTRGLRKFHRGDFKREPRRHAMTQAQLRQLPGYAAAVDDAGEIRRTGKHLLAVVSPNAPPEGIPAAGASVVQSPPLPADGWNYRATSHLPLLPPAGPSVHDILQGQTLDCFFLAPLAAIAHLRPQDLPLQIVREGPDQYRSRFRRNSADTWIRGDSALPSNGARAAASNWVGIYEKAYASYRTGANTYASLNLGFAWNVFNDLGYTTLIMTPSPATDAAVSANLAKGMPVVVMTNVSVPAGVPLIARHAEAVMAFDGKNYTIYNPWGIDGAGTDADPADGTVNVSIAQSRSGGISVFVLATGYTPPATFVDPAPAAVLLAGDANGDRVVDFADFVIMANRFGQATTRGPLDGDFNRDGRTDFADYAILAGNFNASGVGGEGLPAGVRAWLSRQTVDGQWDGVALSWETIDAVEGTVDGKPIAAEKIAKGSYEFNLVGRTERTVPLTFKSKDGTPWTTDYKVTLKGANPPAPAPEILMTIDVYKDGTVKKR